MGYYKQLLSVYFFLNNSQFKRDKTQKTLKIVFSLNELPDSSLKKRKMIEKGYQDSWDKETYLKRDLLKES